jgi:hypothetical protein
MTKTVTEVLASIVSELTPLNSDERQRVVRAALTLLGENTTSESVKRDDVSSRGSEFLPRVRVWMQQNGLSLDQLEQVFHLEGGAAEVIASEIPGNNNRERARNAYMLAGVAQLLVTGEPKFDDRSGRELCETSGFYDPTNHAKFFKSGNEFSGSREKGWVLTSPGLKAAAKVVAEISSKS